MDELIYNEAHASYVKGRVMCLDEKKYDEAIVYLDKAVDSIELFLDSKELLSEEVRKEVHKWFATRGGARWKCKKYQDACFDIGAAISWISKLSSCSNRVSQLTRLEGRMWHRLICSHEGRVSRNPYYNNYITRSSAWKRIRNQRKEVDGDLCVCGRSCFDSGLPIVEFKVHHKTYERVGKELLSDLIRLCEICHDSYHGQVYYADTWPSYQPLP